MGLKSVETAWENYFEKIVGFLSKIDTKNTVYIGMENIDKEKATKHLTILIQPTLMHKFQVACVKNYKTMSEALRDFIRDYIKQSGDK